MECVDLVVNAGGLSRRMGYTKALLPMPPHRTPLVKHIIQRLLPLVTGTVVVVANDAAVAAAVHEEGLVRVVPDRWTDGGALGGMATGLSYCRGWAMAVACDMPYVSKAVFARLLTLTHEGVDVIIPCIGGQAQPFHGLWHTRATASVAAQVDAGELTIQHALDCLPVRWVDEHELSVGPDDPAFLNINTRAQWESLLAQWADNNRPITS